MAWPLGCGIPGNRHSIWSNSNCCLLAKSTCILVSLTRYIVTCCTKYTSVGHEANLPEVRLTGRASISIGGVHQGPLFLCTSKVGGLVERQWAKAAHTLERYLSCPWSLDQRALNDVNSHSGLPTLRDSHRFRAVPRADRLLLFFGVFTLGGLLRTFRQLRCLRADRLALRDCRSPS